jgi:hypothetical protein
VTFGTSLLLDRLGPAHAALDHRNGLSCALSARATFGFFAANRVDADVAELAVEEAVVGAAAEFAIGGEGQAHALLERERIFDGFVFRLGDRGGTDLAAAEPRPRLQ